MVDVAICGGGLTGMAAAYTLAKIGYKVMITDRRGTLGWEIGRARRVFVPLEEAAPHSDFIFSLHERLVENDAYSRGIIHAPVAEIVFDQMMADLGVEVGFHVWPVNVDAEGPANRLNVATKLGYEPIEAAWVIDTTEEGRLGKDVFAQRIQATGASTTSSTSSAASTTGTGTTMGASTTRDTRTMMGASTRRDTRTTMGVSTTRGTCTTAGTPTTTDAVTTASGRTIRCFLLYGVETAQLTDRSRTGKHLEEYVFHASRRYRIRQAGENLVQIDIEMNESTYEDRELGTAQAVVDMVDFLKRKHHGFSEARVVYVSDDEWAPVTEQHAGERAALRSQGPKVGHLVKAQAGAFHRVDLFTDDFQRVGGLVLAGPRLPAYVSTSKTEEEMVINRMVLGEAVARYITVADKEKGGIPERTEGCDR